MISRIRERSSSSAKDQFSSVHNGVGALMTTDFAEGLRFAAVSGNFHPDIESRRGTAEIDLLCLMYPCLQSTRKSSAVKATRMHS